MFVIQEGKHPESRQECEFKISTEKISWLHKYGPDDKFYNLQNVPNALNHPNAIWKGLEREGHENSYCYVAKVARRFVSDTASKPVGDDWVFVVFVSLNLEVFDWRFEKVGGNGKFPENHDVRFTKLIWESNP